jgi:hypothetical protein
VARYSLLPVTSLVDAVGMNVVEVTITQGR